MRVPDGGGITMLNLGTGHAVLLAVSVFSLRRFYDGPITVFCDENSQPYTDLVCQAGNCHKYVLHGDEGVRHRSYSMKPILPSLSPYKYTIQMDTDMIVVGDFNEVWPHHDEELVLTQFSSWVSTGGMMSKRIQMYLDVQPEMTKKQLSKPHPAINTGIVAYGNHNKTARKEWLEVTNQKHGKFIVDEIAMQVLSGTAPKCRILDDRHNCSPFYGVHKDRATIWHFHGSKHIRKEKGKELWLPEFHAACQAKFADVHRWAVLTDKFIAQEPELVPACTT